MSKKLVICLAAIPIALVVAVLLAIFFLNPYIKYHHAKKLLEDGNYDLAYSAFSELDGYGIGYITDIDLPKGKYNFTFTHSGDSNFVLRLNNQLVVNEIGKVAYVYQYDRSAYDLSDGYINVVLADGYWTITIEAVGN